MATSSMDVSAVLADTDLVALLEHERIPVVQRGSRLWASCWQHPDAEPSVILNPPERSTRGRWTYHCFACGQCAGDAIQFVQDRRGLPFPEALAYLTDFSRHAPQPPLGPVTSQPRHLERPSLSESEQAHAVAGFLTVVDEVAPHAREDGRAYLLSRGATASVIEEVGGAYHLRRPHLEAIARVATDRGQVEMWMAAGLLKPGPRGARLIWWDDVTLGVSRLRDGKPGYVWGRRTNPGTLLPKLRYLNQAVGGGARHIPFGLDALSRSATNRVPLRVVEGPTTALGSRSLADGEARPTMAMLRRVGWIRQAPEQLRFWEAILSDLKACPAVEVCPDNDADQAKHAEGVHLGLSLVRWLQSHGIPSSLRCFRDRPLPADVDATLVGPPLPYSVKDLADAAQAPNKV